MCKTLPFTIRHIIDVNLQQTFIHLDWFLALTSTAMILISEITSRTVILINLRRQAGTVSIKVMISSSKMIHGFQALASPLECVSITVIWLNQIIKIV